MMWKPEHFAGGEMPAYALEYLNDYYYVSMLYMIVFGLWIGVGVFCLWRREHDERVGWTWTMGIVACFCLAIVCANIRYMIRASVYPTAVIMEQVSSVEYLRKQKERS